MITGKEAHHGINLGFHIWILFTFLTIFFFTFISRKEKDAVTRELNDAISNSVPEVLTGVDNITQEFGGKISWGKINNFAKKIEKKYNGPDPAIAQHNNKLIITSVIICIVLLVLLICTMLYFSYYKKLDIEMGIILVDNFFIAVFVGIIELLFFMNIALKYTPVTTYDMVNQIIDRAEYHINEELN
jgi:hypothetical protein